MNEWINNECVGYTFLPGTFVTGNYWFTRSHPSKGKMAVKVTSVIGGFISSRGPTTSPPVFSMIQLEDRQFGNEQDAT